MNYYEILELSKTASQDEIKSAYRKMVSLVHPDKGGSAMLFRLVQQAYDVLSDPDKRKQHDSDLAGSTGGGRQPGGQYNQQQNRQQSGSNTSQSESNYIRVEDAYKRWKENRNRVAMPREQSIAAGGVRKMIRDSVLFSQSNLKQGDVDFGFCSNCGWSTQYFAFFRVRPLELSDATSPGVKIMKQGENLGWCKHCKKSLGIFREEVVENWSEKKWLHEEIRIDKDDLLFFFNLPLGWQIHLGLIPIRAAFGSVVEGSARNEFGLESLKVLDEFSGKILTPTKWRSVMGHWKSNDLSKNRTGLMRNFDLST